MARTFLRLAAGAAAACVLAAAAGCVERDETVVVHQQPDPDTVVAVTKSAYTLATGFPSDLQIVDVPGLRDIGFVFDGNSVIALKLGAGTLSTATGISGYTIATSSAFGGEMVILTPNRGLCTASAGSAASSPVSVVEVFDPTNGTNTQTLNVALTYNFGGANDTQSSAVNNQAQGNLAGVCFVPTGGTQGKLYVAMSNVKSSSPSAEYFPGTVQVFSVDWSNGTPVSTTPSTTLITGGFNPTQVTRFTDPGSGNDYVLVTNTGQYQFSGTVNTAASIDVIDTSNDTIVTNIPLGNAAAGFHEIALRTHYNATSGALETFGLVGSALFGNVYQVDLTAIDALNQAATLPGSYTAGVVNDAASPLIVSGSSDFIVDVEAAAGGRYVFVSSFNNGDIRIIDFGGATPALNTAPGPFLIGDPTNFVSANAIELRPGNFEGPELFGVTGVWPGPATLASVQTSLKVSAP
ncbi:MAG: hypothetical protein ACYTGX_00620 [Planctomycetota bacterium]|jgi:hypothetical protein